VAGLFRNKNYPYGETEPSCTCIGSIKEPNEKLALLAFLPMFFLGAAPSYASCVRVPGVEVGCNNHPTYHRARYNEYHHHYYPRHYSHAYYH
jgi:hypothetical protein